MRSVLSLSVLLLFFLSVPVHADDLASLMVQHVGPMERIQLQTGKAAQAQVDKLHGKSLSAEASAIARYAMPGQVDRSAEVWVSRVASAQEARRQTGQMVHLMYENPRSPFKNPRRIDHAGNAVYRFEGMGQMHLIWFKGNLVWWVSVFPDGEAAMLEEFCR